MSFARVLLRESVGIAVCAAIFVGAGLLARALPVARALPPGIVGALVLAALLLTRVLPLDGIAPGCDRLLRHLGLFFVAPAVLAIERRDLLVPALAPLVTLVVVSTTVGLIV